LISIQRTEAFALAGAGETQRALAAFRDLAERLPRDGRVQLEYARLLETGGDAASWKAALTQWSNIALHSPKQSDAWYEAKLGVARARLELGNAKQAAELVQYLLVTSPPPDGSKWAIALREFLARVQ
jgi:predicted Zn-dependent protease